MPITALRAVGALMTALVCAAAYADDSWYPSKYGAEDADHTEAAPEGAPLPPPTDEDGSRLAGMCSGWLLMGGLWGRAEWSVTASRVTEGGTEAWCGRAAAAAAAADGGGTGGGWWCGLCITSAYRPPFMVYMVGSYLF